MALNELLGYHRWWVCKNDLWVPCSHRSLLLVALQPINNYRSLILRFFRYWSAVKLRLCLLLTDGLDRLAGWRPLDRISSRLWWQTISVLIFLLRNHCQGSYGFNHLGLSVTLIHRRIKRTINSPLFTVRKSSTVLCARAQESKSIFFLKKLWRLFSLEMA